jgi:hypothetical protein
MRFFALSAGFRVISARFSILSARIHVLSASHCDLSAGIHVLSANSTVRLCSKKFWPLFRGVWPLIRLFGYFFNRFGHFPCCFGHFFSVFFGQLDILWKTLFILVIPQSGFNRPGVCFQTFHPGKRGNFPAIFSQCLFAI